MLQLFIIMKGAKIMKETQPLEYWTDTLAIQMKENEIPDRDSIMNAYAHIDGSYDKGLYGLVCFYDGFYYYKKGRNTDSVNKLTEAISYLEGTRYDKIVYRCYQLLGHLAHAQLNLTLAMEHYNIAIMYAEKYQMKIARSLIVCSQADVYFRMNSYEKALQYYKRSLKEFDGMLTTSDDEFDLCSILTSYGICLVYANHLEEAIGISQTLQDKMVKKSSRKFPYFRIYLLFTIISNRQKQYEFEKMNLNITFKFAKEQINPIIEFDNALNLLNYLIETKNFNLLYEMVTFVEDKINIKNNDGLYFQLLFMQLQYCNNLMNEEEFSLKTRLFFKMKEQFEETENMQTLQMMEIRNRIRNISLEEQNLQSKNTELLFMMQKDPLSNIANRACLNQYLEQIFSQIEKNKQSLSLLIVDIDYFKQLNDTYGHQIGDQCIQAVAKTI